MTGAVNMVIACDQAVALCGEILAELERARAKFPGENVTTLALVEEVGELARATFEQSRAAVRKEAVQFATMAMRVVLDGDVTLDAWRASKGLEPIVAPTVGGREDVLGAGEGRAEYAFDLDAGVLGPRLADAPIAAVAPADWPALLLDLRVTARLLGRDGTHGYAGDARQAVREISDAVARAAMGPQTPDRLRAAFVRAASLAMLAAAEFGA